VAPAVTDKVGDPGSDLQSCFGAGAELPAVDGAVVATTVAGALLQALTPEHCRVARGDLTPGRVATAHCCAAAPSG
jgi:hypothetical protein